ncbi:hypothetical protein LUZ61_000072 [Rhynchospora tenuis]|uniref:DDE Tnp4 domain-containing protein n=1 Tax=Rhynchospora tenuis TaxID=198213 RepID=A0AAD5ZEB0_9POAL|nr:hypothetical protein LUZ61_000072 [Rhynchospora tenuis]
MSDGDDLSCDGSSSDDLSMEAAAWWYNAAQICAAEWKELKHDRKMSSKQYIMRQLNGHRMDALGAIDGTHINAFPPSGETFKERWRDRKGNMSQNVMAVVDFDGKFLYVGACWEGSAHDNLILRKSLERGNFSVPPGRYYLVDGGYANTPF